jgi:hypothetical protein
MWRICSDRSRMRSGAAGAIDGSRRQWFRHLTRKRPKEDGNAMKVLPEVLQSHRIVFRRFGPF